MATDSDLPTILVLLGLGYLVIKSRKVAEAITTARSSTTNMAVMLSPAWLPPTGWTPIPGPASQKRVWIGELLG